MHTNSDLTESVKYSADLAQQNTDYAQTSKGRPLKIGNDIKFAEYIEDKIVMMGTLLRRHLPWQLLTI